MSTNRQPIIGVLACLAFLMVLITGCPPRPTPQPPSPQPTTLKVGYMPIAECLPLFVAEEQGFFAQRNVQIKEMSFAGGARILEALDAGSVDIGFSNVVSLIFTASARMGIKAVWGTTIENADHPLHAVVVRGDSDIYSVTDLSRKVIAVNTFKNIDELLVTEYLAKNGVSESNINLVEVNFPRMPSVLVNRSVDAIAVVEPFRTITLDEYGARLIGNYFTDTLGEVCITSYCCQEQWARRHADLVKRFGLAMEEAIRYIHENEEESREILTRHTRIAPDVAAKIGLPLFNSEVPSAQSLTPMIELMVKRGWISEPLDPAEVLYK